MDELRPQDLSSLAESPHEELSHVEGAEVSICTLQREREMAESWVSSSIQENPNEEETNESLESIFSSSTFNRQVEREEGELPKLRSLSSSGSRKKKKKNQVLLEGYVDSADEDDLSRTKSLTDEDLDELKGCLDLGFGFSYEEIPELCNTLLALELCYSMSQRFMDKSPETSPAALDSCSSVSSPIANWKISSPGDHPEVVKVRLKYWAQVVACTVRLCS
ncbi:uncharacterized protein LOC133711140 [Rosa rugosa]|uniref:uncharacterized protein LOC133711140 n=1 Tax=Rosa rugosa TaxID=74645 RepID=UPI002B40DEB7|nr:uncharacterized protein LOC133711140 [Rosa rugosa]